MAYLGNAFDPNAVEPAQPMEPVPAGDYVAIITDSQMRDTKNGGGQYLELTHQVIEGEYKGRLIWARLNIRNASEKAQQIAQQQLSAICHAVGMRKAIQDSEELHNRPMAIRVAYLPGNDEKGWQPKNEIKAWKAIDGQQTKASTHAPAPPAARAQAPAPAARTAAARPWTAGAR